MVLEWVDWFQAEELQRVQRKLRVVKGRMFVNLVGLVQRAVRTDYEKLQEKKRSFSSSTDWGGPLPG